MPVASFMQQLGAQAPEFALPEVTDGSTVALDDVMRARGVVVMFLCRHCPFVKHVQDEVAAVARHYGPQEVGFVAIMPNDIAAAPDDAPEFLAEQKALVGFTFPYLYDEDQKVAHAYGAACTPDFFVYDADKRLVYRGRLDATRPGGPAPDGADLRAALDALVAGQDIDSEQIPSIGCSIKWRPGNEPVVPAQHVD